MDISNDPESKAVDSRNTVSSSASNSSDEDSRTNRNEDIVKEDNNENNLTEASTSSSPQNKIQSILTNKKRIIHRYFDELNQTYVQAHNKDWKDFHIKGLKKNRLIQIYFNLDQSIFREIFITLHG